MAARDYISQRKSPGEKRSIADYKKSSPKPEHIRAAYEFVGISPKAAANLIGVPLNQFSIWEKGILPMPYGMYELLLLKIRQKGNRFGDRSQKLQSKQDSFVWYPPLPHEIKAAREKIGFSMKEAASLIYVPEREWQQYESGDARMFAGLYHLFLLKTHQLDDEQYAH